MAYRKILEEEGRQGRILPGWDPRVRMVERVMGRLIEGGKLGTGTAPGKEVGWEVFVIDDPGEFVVRVQLVGRADGWVVCRNEECFCPSRRESVCLYWDSSDLQD